MRVILSSDDKTLAKRILPYLKEVVLVQGTDWQYFNLAAVELLLNNEKGALVSIRNAIDLAPHRNVYWDFQHYINVLKVSRSTRRPIDEFFLDDALRVNTKLDNVFSRLQEKNDSM